ncbi:MAG: L-serine ammonia-lyase, iron-sulfur-dependent, subunit alpha [bacterium]|nr:L-serine ammonia-lyase, iron-sulfur-dependent, subunit alpha [bacterium]
MKNVVKQVLKSEVHEALGCTEPVAVAYACSWAVKSLVDMTAGHNADNWLTYKLNVEVTPGIFKNARGVNIPFANGKKGLAYAAALGVFGNPALGLSVLKDMSLVDQIRADKMVEAEKVRVSVNSQWKNDIKIKVTLKASMGRSVVVTEDHHTNIVCITVNEVTVDLGGLFSDGRLADASGDGYGLKLDGLSIQDMVELASAIDQADRQDIWNGINMNLELSEAGLSQGKFGSQLKLMVENGSLGDDVFSSTKIMAACATDARMAGVNLPAMSSGCSGNQGIVAILVPYNVGVKRGVDSGKIAESIALSHLLNAYVKRFTGKLAPMCGCSIAAGLGATAAIAYQLSGDALVIGSAINNLVADIAGIICDGAKSGCSLKVITATDCAIRSALFAINGVSVSGVHDGIISHRAENTIKNLGRINSEGMKGVDRTVMEIIRRN